MITTRFLSREMDLSCLCCNYFKLASINQTSSRIISIWLKYWWKKLQFLLDTFYVWSRKSPFTSSLQGTIHLAWLALAGLPKTPCVVNCIHVDHNHHVILYHFKSQCLHQYYTAINIFIMTLYGSIYLMIFMVTVDYTDHLVYIVNSCFPSF